MSTPKIDVSGFVVPSVWQQFWMLSRDFPDLEAIHESAVAAGGLAAEELAPGVTRAEAEAATVHAILIQGGSAHVDREAQRIAWDRGRLDTKPR